MFWANVLGMAVFTAVLAFAIIVATMAGEAIYVDGIKAGVQLGEGRLPRSWIETGDQKEETND